MKKGKMIIEKEDTPTHLPMDVLSILADAQEVSSEMSIAQNDAPVKKNTISTARVFRRNS